MAILSGVTDPLSLRAVYENKKKETERDEPGDFLGGLKSGGYGLASSFHNAAAAGARLAGADSFAARQERKAQKDATKAAAVAEGAGLKNFTDIDSIGSAIDWAQSTLGSQTPLLATMAATAATGGIAAPALGASRIAAAGVNAAAKAAQLSKVGRLTGTALPYGATSTGSNYGSILNDPDAEGTPQQAALASFGAAVPQTALGMLLGPERIFGGLMRGTTTGLLDSAKRVGLEAIGEGAAEVGEELIQTGAGRIFNPNLQVDPHQLLEAGAAGALLGGGFAIPGQINQLRKLAEERAKTPVEKAAVEYQALLASGTELSPEQVKRKTELETMFSEEHSRRMDTIVSSVMESMTPELRTNIESRANTLREKPNRTPAEQEQLDVLERVIDQTTPIDLQAFGQSSPGIESLSKEEHAARFAARTAQNVEAAPRNVEAAPRNVEAAPRIEGFESFPKTVAELKAANTLTYKGKPILAAPIAALWDDAKAAGRSAPEPQALQNAAEAGYRLRYEPLQIAEQDPNQPSDVALSVDSAPSRREIVNRDGTFHLDMPDTAPKLAKEGVTLNGIKLTPAESKPILDAVKAAYYEGRAPTVEELVEASGAVVGVLDARFAPKLSAGEHKIVDNNGTYTVTDQTTGDTLELPGSYEALLGGTIKLNGKEIKTPRAVYEAIARAAEAGRQITTGELLDTAANAVEYERTPSVGYAANSYRPDPESDPELMEFEPENVLRRPRPLQDQFGVQEVTLKHSGGTKGYNNVVDSIRREMAAKGFVIVGAKDNHLYFATPEQRDALYNMMDVYGPLTNDAYMVERVGVLLAKESNRTYDLRIPQGVSTHDTTTHDGLMYAINGAPVNQGFTVRKVSRPDGSVYYEFDKGMGRSPLIDFGADFTVDGNGRVRLGKEQNREAETINTELQLGHDRAAGFEGDTMTVYRMKPPAEEQGDSANLQQILFSLLQPLKFMVRDRLQGHAGKTLSEYLKGASADKSKLGIDARLFMTVFDAITSIMKYDARSARGYVFSSDLVGLEDVKLLPDTYRELNLKYRQLYGRDLKVGDELFVHRDPALTDATSMRGYKFAGIVTLQAGDQQRGFVVNPKSPAWKESGGDFDGDTGVVMIPDPEGLNAPRPSEALASGDLVKGKAQRKDPLTAKPGYSPEALRGTAKDADLLDDFLSKVVAEKATMFSQMIGMIISKGQILAEMGALNREVSVPLPDANGNWPAGVTVDENGQLAWPPGTPTTNVTMAQLIAKVGQASISAKKKAVWVNEAMALLNGVDTFVKNAAPGYITAGGQFVTAGKHNKRVERPAFTRALLNFKRAPRKLPKGVDYEPFELVTTKHGGDAITTWTREPVTKDEHWDFLVFHATDTVADYNRALVAFVSTALAPGSATDPKILALIEAHQKAGEMQLGKKIPLEELLLEHPEVEVSADFMEYVSEMEAAKRVILSTKPAFSLLLRAPIHVELARRVLAADPLVQAHLNSKDEPGFSATLVNAAQRDVSGKKKALRAQIAELSREYNGLYAEMRRLYEEFGEDGSNDASARYDEYRGLLDSAQAIEQQIRIATAVGAVDAADLLTSAPKRIAARYASVAQLRELTDRASTGTNGAPLLLRPVRVDGYGNVTDLTDTFDVARTMPQAGLFRLDPTTGLYELYTVEGNVPTPTGKFYRHGMGDVQAADLSVEGRAVATLAAGNNGFVVIRRKPASMAEPDKALDKATEIAREFKAHKTANPAATPDTDAKLKALRDEYQRVLAVFRFMIGSVIASRKGKKFREEFDALIDPKTKLSDLRAIMEEGHPAREAIQASINEEATKLADGTRRSVSAMYATADRQILSMKADVGILQAMGQSAEDVPYVSSVNTVADGRTRAGIVKKLKKLSEHFDKRTYQKSADVIADLLGLPRVEIVNADRIFDILEHAIAANPANEAALREMQKKILDGKWTGAFFWGGSSPMIYVAGNANLAVALETIAHEMGHYLVHVKMAQAPADLQMQIQADFKAEMRTRFKRAKVPFDAMTEGEQHHLYNEWLADQIGRFIVVDVLPKTPAEKLFAELAEALKQLISLMEQIGNKIFPNAKWSKGVTPASVRTFVRAALTAPAVETPPDPASSPGSEPVDPVEYIEILVNAEHAILLRAYNPKFQGDHPKNQAAFAMIRHQLDKLLAPQDLRELTNIAMQPDVQARMRTLLGESEAVTKQLYEPYGAAAYLYMLAVNGLMAPPQRAQGLMAKLTAALANFGGSVNYTPEEQWAVLSQLARRNVHPANPIFPAGSKASVLLNQRIQQRSSIVGSAMFRMSGMFKKAFSWYIDVPHQRLVDTRIPELIRLARVLQPQAWEINQFKPGGYLERAHASYHMFADRLGKIIDSLSEAERAELEDLLFQRQFDANATSTNQNVKDALGKMTYVMNRMHEFAEKMQGRELNYRANYWPFIPDADYVRSNLDTLQNLFISTPDLRDGWEGVRRQYAEWVLKHGTEIDGNTPAESSAIVKNMPLNEFVRYYLTKSDIHDLPGWQLEAVSGSKHHNPAFRFSNPRLLNFMLPYANTPGFREAFHHDSKEIMQRYVKALTKRATFDAIQEALGPGGIDGALKLAARQGATKEQLRVAKDYVEALNGFLGIKERDAFDGFIRAHSRIEWLQQFDSEGRSIVNPKINALRNFFLFWQMVTKLTLSVFSSLIDPLGQLLIHGDGKIFASSMKTTYNNLVEAFKGNPTEARRMLQMVGVMERRFASEDLLETHLGPETTPMLQRFATIMFRANGVEWVSNRARESAGLAASTAFIQWSQEAQGNDPERAKLATRRLAEFGLKPSDVIWSDTGSGPMVIILELEQKGAVGSAEWERDDRLRVAINRFVDQAQVRPDPANRPLYASNPYFAVMAQWKGFITAFDNQILRPTWARMEQEGNATPLMWMLLTFIPVMFFADMVRDAIKTAFDEDDENNRPTWKDGWTLADHIAYSVQRAGLYGRFELVDDIITPLMNGKIPEAAAELLGPTASDLRKVNKYGLDSLPTPFQDAIGAWE